MPELLTILRVLVLARFAVTLRRFGSRRLHHPTRLGLCLLVLFSACDSASASESARVYRPLQASCLTPPQASGEGLQPAVFFDEEDLSDEAPNATESDAFDAPDPLDRMLAADEGDATSELLLETSTELEDPLFASVDHDLLSHGDTALVSEKTPSRTASADRLDELQALEGAELDTLPHAEPDGPQEPHPPHPHNAMATDEDRDEGDDAPDSARDERSAQPPQTEPAEAEPAIAKINLNTATEAELTSIRGIGPALAGRILEYRSRRPFTRLSHLKRVKGIGPATFQRLAPYLTVEDAPPPRESAAQN